MDQTKNIVNKKKEPILVNMEQNLTALLIIDVQERLIKAIDKNDLIVRNIRKLILASNILKFDKFFTEQNPEKLGTTINTLLENEDIHVYTKMSFSCIACNDLIKSLEDKKIKNLVLCGIESHICVQQTAIDLMNKGFNIFIAIDAIGSRKSIDNYTAIRRLETSGAIATTCESIIFEWCITADRKEFKAISKLIREG